MTENIGLAAARARGWSSGGRVPSRRRTLQDIACPTLALVVDPLREIPRAGDPPGVSKTSAGARGRTPRSTGARALAGTCPWISRNRIASRPDQVHEKAPYSSDTVPSPWPRTWDCPVPSRTARSRSSVRSSTDAGSRSAQRGWQLGPEKDLAQKSPHLAPVGPAFRHGQGWTERSPHTAADPRQGGL